jgi:competence protein ComEC
LCVGVALLAGSLAASARAGLTGVSAESAEGEVTLLTDPERFGDEVRVEVRLDRRHLEAWASGSAGDVLAERLAGDRVTVRGRVEPFASLGSRQLSRHLAGRLETSQVRSWRPGGLPSRIANGYRSLLTQGSQSLDDDQRSLLAGLVLGDDRAQSPALVDAFRGAGLTHLLAVSGQNVAFVLLVVEPLLRRLPLGGRVVLVLAVLALFGVVTRFEPSVLRATAMAGVAIVSTALGRPAGGRRALALAVTGLLLIDPLLVHSVGFTLSVAASCGIVMWSGPISDRLPVAPWLGRPVGVIAAAQLAVAPVLITTFGLLPMASFPANLLAGPAAGPAMVWGMTAGAVAGLVPHSAAWVIHLPTQVLLGWIELVARVAAALPLGGMGALSLAALGVALLWWWVGPRSRSWRRVGPIIATAGLITPVAVALLAPIPVREPLAGAAVWRSGGDSVLVVQDETRPVALLAELRRARVRGLDLIAAEVPLTDDTVDALRDRFGPVPLLATEGAAPRLPIGPAGSEVQVGSLLVIVRVGGRRPVLDVVMRRDGVDKSTGLPSRESVGPLVALTDDPSGPGRAGRRSRLRAPLYRSARSPGPIVVGPDVSFSKSGSGAGASLRVRSPGALGARAPPLRRDPPSAGDGHPQPHSGFVLRPGSLLGL